MGVQELAVVGLVGSGVGAALSVPMVWPGRDRTLDPRLLGGAMLMMSAIAALISARLAGFVPTSLAVDHAINLFGLCAFPLAVVYTRLACGASRAWAPALWLPAATYLALTLARRLLGADTGVPFAWLLPVALTFTAMSVSALWHRQAPVSAPLVPPAWVVGFQVVLNLAQIVRMDFGHVPVVRAIVPLVLAGAFVAMVSFVAWRSLAAPVAGAHEVPPSGRGPMPAGPPAPAPGRYERSGLDQAAAADLLASIDRALAEGRLFARADLSLAQLAGAVGSTAHQVSEALNRFGGVTFHELVNRHRVDDVKAQLEDPSSDRYTIEGIGASAGFGSRSALYAAFHRAEGMTPTAFRASRRRTALV